MVTCYHVDRLGQLAPNLILDLKRPTAGDQVLQAHVDALFPDGLSPHGEKYFAGDSIAMQKPAYVIELLWEYVRRTEAPDAPSRYQSCFGTKTLREAENFASRITKPPMPTIWSIEGDVGFDADMQWLTMGNLAGGYTALWASYRANCYWRQQLVPNREEDGYPLEVLLRPPVRVKERVR